MLHRHLLAAIACALAFTSSPTAQSFCPDQGSDLRPGTLDPGPEMGCVRAPGWPWWHLYTPPFRAVVDRPGRRQGQAHAYGRVLVRWRCTGLVLVPVVPDQLRLLGYVTDVAEEECTVVGR